MMNIKTLKVRYISDKKSIFSRKTIYYEAYIPKDDNSEKYCAFLLEEMDEPGDCALPSSMFEIVKEYIQHTGEKTDSCQVTFRERGNRFMVMTEEKEYPARETR